MRENKIFKLIDFWIGIPLCMFLGLITKILYKKGLNKPIAKILFIKLSALGDTILILPLLKEIKNQIPGVRLSMVVTEINNGALENFKYIDNLILFEPKEYILNPFGFISFFSKLRTNRYDIVIDADQWLRISAIISFFTFAKMRIGFKTKGQFNYYCFTEIVKHRKDEHELECFFELVKPIGIIPENKGLIPLHGNSDIKKSEELLRRYNIGPEFIVLHPEVPSHGKQRAWPLENFALLAEKLKQSYDYKIVITSSANGRKLADKLNQLLRNSGVVISGLPLKILSAFVSKARFVICSNTGFMHLAAASGTKVIALHGPTNSIKWGPYGEKHITINSSTDCSPCLYLGFEYKCHSNKCMQAITAEDVFDLVKK